MTRRHLRVDGIQLCVEESGRGTSVALLHGFTGSALDLEDLAGKLARRHRVLAIDLVGHGHSDAPELPTAYAMERCIAQVAALLDATNAVPAHLFGYSMGGRIALGVAVRRPRALRSLSVLGASAGIEDAEQRAERRRADEALAERIEREGLADFVDFWGAQPLFATQSTRLSVEARAALRTRRLENRAHGLANALRGMGSGAQTPFHDALGELDLPVWLAHGADDSKFAAIARDLAERLPHGECVAIPEAGHAAHLENPDAVYRALEHFLARAEAAERSSTPVQGPTPPRASEGAA